MNCETCQELIHDLIDGSISQRDEFTLNTHLKECLDCESVRQDLAAIVGFARTQREEYAVPPNEHALWLRIRNSIEAELPSRAAANTERRPSFLGRLMGHSWELSLPQLAASAVAIVLLVSLATVVGLRRWGGYSVQPAPPQVEASNVNDLMWRHKQAIEYWNQRVELSKARWTPEMRTSFNATLAVIDQQVADSLNELKEKPQDTVSQDLLNESLNRKLQFLKDFSDL
jgi:hypothetical protein